MTRTTGAKPQTPSIALPTIPLLLAGPLAALGTGLVCYAVARTQHAELATTNTFLLGAAIVAAIVGGSVVMMMPWKTRPISEWMSWWLGATVMRMLVTPACAFLLYSAAPLPANPLALGVAAAYLVSLLCEAAVLARHVRKYC